MHYTIPIGINSLPAGTLNLTQHVVDGTVLSARMPWAPIQPCDFVSSLACTPGGTGGGIATSCTNGGNQGICVVNTQPVTVCGIRVTITPFTNAVSFAFPGAQFQSGPGTGESADMDVYFSEPVKTWA